MQILVSAVIPTVNRPDLLLRAVRSVLSQSFSRLEVVVVIDGPNEQTLQALKQIDDVRLRIVALKSSVGGCEARNIGVRQAQGKYIALLDDDDEWLPTKIAKQVTAAEELGGESIFVTSQFIERNQDQDLTRPRKFPHLRQHISEFLWGDVSLIGGMEGFPQTSTWFLSRSVLLQFPFTVGLKALQDLDWLLHAYMSEGLQITWLKEPLVIFHNESTRDRVTKQIDWQFSRKWALQNRSLFTKNALAFFLVIYCLNPAARQRTKPTVLASIFRDCWTFGKVTPKLLWLSLLYSLLYPVARRFTSAKLERRLQYKVTSFFGAIGFPPNRSR